MSKITWKEIDRVAVPGDKLLGSLPQYTSDLSAIKIVPEITFWQCVGCLTGKEDIRAGATHFVNKEGKFEIVGGGKNEE